MIPVLYKGKQYQLVKIQGGYLHLGSYSPPCDCGSCYDCDDGYDEFDITEIKITKSVDVNAIIRSTYDIVEKEAESLLRQAEYNRSKRPTKAIQKQLLECIPL